MEFIIVGLFVAFAAFVLFRDRQPRRRVPPRVVCVPESAPRNEHDDRAERDWLTDPANPLSPLSPFYWTDQ